MPRLGRFLFREQRASVFATLRRDKESNVCVRRRRTLFYCHSRVGGNRDYTVRANASQTQTIAMLFDKGYQAVFAEYCITVNESNFLVPIPAYAGMTRSENCFLFYGHCLCLGCGLSSPLARGVPAGRGVSSLLSALCALHSNKKVRHWRTFYLLNL